MDDREVIVDSIETQLQIINLLLSSAMSIDFGKLKDSPVDRDYLELVLKSLTFTREVLERMTEGAA